MVATLARQLGPEVPARRDPGFGQAPRRGARGHRRGGVHVGVLRGLGLASRGFQSEEAARDDLERGFVRPEEDYRVTLDEPGTYAYICIPHESSGMRGTIVVEG